jgi:hypothetical protein
MSVRASGLAALVLLGCRPATPTTTKAPDDSAPAALPTSRHAAGEVLDANIPLAHGGVLPLASLRGKVVILELGGAADRDATVEADYAALAESSGAGLAIVMVALDPGGWHDDAPPHTLGWDPQGALAAKLRAATLPTVIVLDTEGRIAHQYGGARTSGHPETIATAKRLLTAPGR